LAPPRGRGPPPALDLEEEALARECLHRHRGRVHRRPEGPPAPDRRHLVGVRHRRGRGNERRMGMRHPRPTKTMQFSPEKRIHPPRRRGHRSCGGPSPGALLPSWPLEFSPPPRRRRCCPSRGRGSAARRTPPGCRGATLPPDPVSWLGKEDWGEGRGMVRGGPGNADRPTSGGWKHHGRWDHVRARGPRGQGVTRRRGGGAEGGGSNLSRPWDQFGVRSHLPNPWNGSDLTQAWFSDCK